MSNIENLRPFKAGKQARENGRKGGIASGQARREKRAMRDTASLILSMPLNSKALADVGAITLAETKGKNVTVEEAALLAIAKQAIEGDYKALEFLRDTAGEKPTDRLAVETPPDIEQARADLYAQIEEMRNEHEAMRNR